ncbi:MAG: thioredoxin fold domain-containing protein [Gammaproteobacteria bacterium]|nr:thioredoxin fold domain-containing protein [Gammaproteobacteria bacterium]
MNPHPLRILWLWLCLLISWQLTAAETPKGRIIGGQISQHPAWFKESFLDIREDTSEAAAAGKHLILFMHLNGCPYCYRMTEENFKHAPYTDFIQDNFDVIQINIKGDREIAFDENTTVTEKELAKLLKVRYTPTVLFLNADNKTVLRLNGYRSVRDFEYALKYVQEQAYLQTTLSGYVAQHPPANLYHLRQHPQMQAITDLSGVASQPLLVLFEDSSCDLCDELHDGHLKNDEVNSVLKNYTFVRLDAGSSEPIIDPEGNHTTPHDFAERLGLSYRPGIVLYDKGKEISRIDGLLYSYHFVEMLRYVGERHYEKYPKGFYDYLDARTASLLAEGKDIDLSK